MKAARYDIVIQQGRNFSESVRISQDKYSYVPITGATKAAPCVLTAAAHGVPVDWPFQIRSVLGMTELNNPVTKFNDQNVPIEWGNGANGKKYYRATVPTAGTIELNDINALDFAAYISGGVVVFQPPLDLSVYTSARMQIRASVDSTDILQTLAFTTNLLIDTTNKKVVMQLSAVETAAITWEAGVYDLELVTAAGVVDCPVYGSVKVNREVTR